MKLMTLTLLLSFLPLGVYSFGACGGDFTQIAQIELQSRIEGLVKSIYYVRTHESEDPALAQTHLKRLESELKVLMSEGVLPPLFLVKSTSMIFLTKRTCINVFQRKSSRGL